MSRELNLLKEDVQSLRFWKNGVFSWHWRFREHLINKKLGDTPYTDEEVKQMNQALDLIRQAVQIYKSIALTRIGQAIWRDWFL